MSFNKTSLNKAVVSKILKACKAALSNESGASYITNRKGAPFLRVKKVVSITGKIGFEILNKANKNIAGLIGSMLIIERKAEVFCGKRFANGLAGFIGDRVLYPHEIAA